MNELPELPAGLDAALMQDTAAMEWFSGLSPQARQAIVERTRSIRSPEEMRAFVGQMGRDRSLY